MSSHGGTSNPEYVNARVRSRRAALFEEDDYRKLARMSPAEIARFMEESPAYEEQINALGSRFSGVDLIEYALNASLAEDFEDILSWCEGALYGHVARYLRKFDAWNVKTVLRGVYADTDREAVSDDLIRAGEFDDRLLERLLDADSIEEIVELLSGTVFGRALGDALDDYESTGVLVPLENAVDRAYYKLLRTDDLTGEALSEYREFLEAEIDFRNAINTLRLARSGADIDPSEYFIEGGVLFSAAGLRQLASNTDELIQRIRESRYGEELSEALTELEAAESLIGFERALEVALLEYADSLGLVHPLSVTPVVSYVLTKEREVDNIRAIARGKEAGLGPEEIESELVVL
ncbi:V-type ATP synthase subunit C [Halobaculum gomorrense]|uniref:A-type ATP synthase subunit C n=1 Tax=Halobaculum gomorrense TaxID=43928 RepID=A0A1M5KDM9_9EURY|nr:V-type ATP synthase subunit C [Halobaculum gomorrense]SHG50946.1 V/A-type H+-transporting ATPase subunit C [Halobaculum gomorrense]